MPQSWAVAQTEKTGVGLRNLLLLLPAALRGTPMEVVVPHMDTIPWPSALPAKARCLAFIPGQSSRRGAWWILPLLFSGCVTLGRPLYFSELLHPQLENAYYPRFTKRTRWHEVCGCALETAKSTAKVRTYHPLHQRGPNTRPSGQTVCIWSWPHHIQPE